MAIDKIVVVTRKTPLEELIERFSTRAQAKFYIEHAGADFAAYEAEHEAYQRSLELLRRSLPDQPIAQFIERGYVPTFQFGERDLVVTIGQDGLVVNVAKYLAAQPILALNPDPERIDGVLIPFRMDDARRMVRQALEGRVKVARLSMAAVQLNDGQELLALNDLFIGPKTPGAAASVLRGGAGREPQSSSGIIVSTGTGSTGWLQSIVTGAIAVSGGVAAQAAKMGMAVAKRPQPPALLEYFMDGAAEELYFTVREPFTSRTSRASLVFGKLRAGDFLYVTSQMPGYGVIFSDGVESDFVAFNSGAIAKIGLSQRKAHLIVSG